MKTVRYEAGTHTLILPSDIHVATQNRYFVECDTTEGAITINLPNIIGVKWFNFDIVVSHVSEANAGITINAASGQTINGSESLSIDTVGATGKLIVANNLEWSFLDEGAGGGEVGNNSPYVQFHGKLSTLGGTVNFVKVMGDFDCFTITRQGAGVYRIIADHTFFKGDDAFSFVFSAIKGGFYINQRTNTYVEFITVGFDNFAADNILLTYSSFVITKSKSLFLEDGGVLEPFNL
jgi:hypothetical protein